MFGIHDYAMFVAAGILLNLTPGQDTLYIVGRAVAQGRRIGVASALGIIAGGLLHTLAAALGLSAILATSTTAFLILKWVGAAYLIYLGTRLLLARRLAAGVADATAAVNVAAAFRQGVLTNVTNPKVALFFLAFLPQFIDPASATKIAAFLVLGATFVTTGAIWCLVLVWAAGTLRNVIAPSATAGVLLNRICGALFIALGLRLVASKL
jgi:threonine/homoserine/homoserine lactone efflux protein